MPIKPENRAAYPADWDDISLQAKISAGWKCQHRGCTARQYAVGEWLLQGVRANWFEHEHHGHEEEGAYQLARQRAAELQWATTGDDPEAQAARKIIVIVLTTMHLDHDPTNCNPANLLVACQRHHLQYDQQHHNQSAYMTRMAKRGNQELPL